MPVPRTRSSAALLLVASLLFAGLSVAPWHHLVSGVYVARFGLFTLGLALLAAVLATLARRALGMSGVAATLAASLLVFAPVWWWNRVGPIDVVLLHLDSLRAANCSLAGYERRTTPNLERFAEEGATRFERFLAQSAGTDKSTPAMLAGIHPSMFYDPWKDGGNFLVPDRFPMLGQLLRPHGYASYGLSSNPMVSSARNYDRGFDRFDEVWLDDLRAHGLLALLRDRVQATDGPYFAFGLILDPHSPYTPLPEYDVFSAPDAPRMDAIVERVLAGEPMERFVAPAIDYYDGEILEVDDAVGELVAWLEETGRLERTMLIVTSDHGEKFLEQGELGHGGTLFEEVIHVPMVWHFPSPLRFPALRPRPGPYRGLACHVDILPTVLGFLGLPLTTDAPRGENLVPWLYGADEPPERRILCEELGDGVAVRALRGERHKAIVRERQGAERAEELWELEPAGLLTRERPAAASGPLAELVAELDRRVAELRAFYAPKPDEAPISAETEARLRALGY